MADLLQTGAEWLRDKLRLHASRSVTIKRGAQSTSVSATIGSSLLRLTDPVGGSRIERTDRDYLIAAEDYAFAGTVTRPRRGDRIEDATDGRAFECMAPQSEPAWRYSDARNTILRIHVKDVGAL